MLSQEDLIAKTQYYDLLISEIELAKKRITAEDDEKLADIFAGFTNMKRDVNVRLAEWSKTCKKMAKCHGICAEKFESRHTKMKLSYLILSSLAGLGILFPYMKVLFLISTEVALILGAVLTFLKYEEKYLNHKSAKVQYNYLKNKIDTMLHERNRSDERTNVLSAEVVLKMNNIESESPLVPRSVLEKIKKEEKI